MGAADGREIRFSVGDRTLNRIDDRLFGHFMERASFGEIGPEGALVPGTRRLQPLVVDLLKRMKIPIVRFPGGTDVDYIDWRDMIDNVPGRAGGRPVTVGHTGREITNSFGYDEFLRLCEELQTEPLIVVNFLDGLSGKGALEGASLRAAGLVAYCNAPVGTALPAGMPDWPAIRAGNGRERPYHVRYFQIGNEWWGFFDRAVEKAGIRGEKDAAAWCVECALAYIDAMRAVDPSIQIIIEGNVSGNERILREVLANGSIKAKVQYVAHHRYRPWGIQTVKRSGREYPIEKLTAEEIWNAWVAMPGVDPETGESVEGGGIRTYRELGYKVAATEWNWNGRWGSGHGKERPKAVLDSLFAKGVGAAGWLHAFMRDGDLVEIACQSMLVGVGWDIHGITADPEGRRPPYFHPTGQATMFYSKHHGERRLALAHENVPTYRQPYEMGNLKPEARVICIDALATADEDAVYFHAINRHFERPFDIRIDLSAVGGLRRTATQHLFEGRLRNEPEAGEPREMGFFRDETLELDEGALRVRLPKRSVSIIEFERR